MRLLLVEDDPDLGQQIKEMLAAEGFAVDWCEDGPSALALGLEEPFDAAIVDPGLPGLDGFTVLRRWRDKGVRVPVIVLTGSRTDIEDMKDAVRAGATNYLTKPVDLELLLEWVRGVVNSRGPNVSRPVLSRGPLRLDTAAQKVWFNAKPVHLSMTEYRILHSLMTAGDEPVSAADLLARNFDGDAMKTKNEIPVYISRLRDKLDRKLIENVYGQGYRLVLDP